MELHLSWQHIALRLLLAATASLLLGLNRDEHGHPAGMRTTMLVTLAAALSALQMNLLLTTDGRTPTSFTSIDVMRLPLGVLSGIGFIGAGAIMKRDDTATGVTTAATLWFSTILGLLFGAGQIWLGVAATCLALAILLGLKPLERLLPRRHRANLKLQFAQTAVTEDDVRDAIRNAHCRVEAWSVEYVEGSALSIILCKVSWRTPGRNSAHRPSGITDLQKMPGLIGFRWDRTER